MKKIENNINTSGNSELCITHSELQQIFRNPYSLEVWQNLLISLFGASEIRKTPAEIESDKQDKVSGYLLGELNTSDHYRIGLFAFEVGANTKIEMNRVGLRSLVRSYTKYQYDAAISVYYNDKQWRLSFISDLKGENTSPKRFTYVFGNEVENYRTAAGQLIKLYNTKPTFESIKDAFSVEKLSRDFFAEYKKQYDKFVGSIGDNKSNRDYVKKMMGRLVFLQFLQKKGWMNGDLNYLQNLYNNSEHKDDFLEKVLEPLFFEVLNTKEDNRKPEKIENLGTKVEIPYLNGGLFERDSNDQRVIIFDASYFENLLEFFSHYNFTIDENDPYDAEVGIDPEMLGHIFENLLEDNKDKGAFYTPKEIVQYMCRQSLIEYLQSKLGKHSEIEAFVNRHDVSSKFIIGNAGEIEKHLDKVKICDPAIGSGAFPMGILNEIFHCKMALDLTLDRAETKKAIIQNSIYGVDIEQGAVDIARLRFWLSLVVDEEVPQPLPNLDYKIMCGNSLLSRHALDVPLDEAFAKYNQGKSGDDVVTLSKLKGLDADYTLESDKNKKSKLKDIINDIKSSFRVSLNDRDRYLTPKYKKLLKKYYPYIYKSEDIFGEIANRSTLSDADKLELMDLENELNSKSALVKQAQDSKLYADAFEWRFEFPALLSDKGDFVGFDIMIGNPPYVDVKSLENDYVKEYFKNYNTTTNRINLYSIFIERGYNLIKENGVLCYINPNSMLVNSSYKKLRELIVNDVAIIVKLPDNIFETATVETIVFLLSKGADNGIVRAKYFSSNDRADLKEIDYSLFERNVWKNDSDVRFNIFTDSKTISLLLKLENKGSKLINLADFSLGITPYDKAKGHSQEFIKSKGFHSSDRLSDEYVPLIKGANIFKYVVIGQSGEYLKYSDKLGAPRQKRFFTDEKVIVRQILSTNPLSMVVAYSDADHYFTQIGFSILSKNKDILATKVLLCMLNSKLINFYHNAKYLDSEKITFPKILIESCKNFPIVIPEQQQPYIDRVTQILEKKRENPQADTSALEAEIDQMVYALYNLTPEEINLIENR